MPVVRLVRKRLCNIARLGYDLSCPKDRGEKLPEPHTLGYEGSRLMGLQYYRRQPGAPAKP